MNNQPQNEIFWCKNNIPTEQPYIQHIDTEVAIIGGGIAGLSAAQAFSQKGKKVVLLEKHFCGSGASGKAGGFITPNAELSLSDFEKQTNHHAAKNIWNFIQNGIHIIQENITKNQFNCDYKKTAGLFLANCPRTLKNLQQEYENILQLNEKSTFFNQKELQHVIGSKKYTGGMTYDNSFGINPYQYCQSLKELLQQQDVSIFENSPVTSIKNHTITTKQGTVTAKYIVVCLDKFSPDLNILKDYVYHVQNYILVSQPLASNSIKKIFPQNPYMIWDSQLIYNYYRLIDNNRLLLGGGDIFSLFASKEKFNYTYGFNKLNNYIKNVFPDINFKWQFQWPGLIGISKDVAPLAEPDQKNPHIYYIAGAAGLPIATALGYYSAEHLLDKRTDLDDFFKADRKYLIGNAAQKLLGKKLSFAINNFMSQDTVGCF